jgi:predicted metalloprotease with PDZ domain
MLCIAAVLALSFVVSPGPPVVRYLLRVDSADLSALSVEMRIRKAPDTLRLAMAAHPEYDDKYWRYVEGLTIEGRDGMVTPIRKDSALWQAVVPGGTSVVRYRLRLPPETLARRRAWQPFLSGTGGAIGGPHSFMYLADATGIPAHVRLTLPAGWEAITGLESTSDALTFYAPNVEVLVDSPILVGRIRTWRFLVEGVPHRVAYWPQPAAALFDTANFVGSLERLAQQAFALFGSFPYREYTFLYQDGAVGGLEHHNSVSLGAPSSDLASNVNQYLMEAAHEFVHTWNLMHLRPAERGGVDHRAGAPSRGLWWSEGLTLFYADLLLRRAGLPRFEPTRTAHLEYLIGRYLSSPGNSRVSPEAVSLVAYGAPPGSLGDLEASTHLQGELLGTMLDLIVRDATGGRRSIDDVMRAMVEQFSGTRGFAGRDIEATTARICGCRVGEFFTAHVRGATPIDFDRYLGLAGLVTRVASEPALGRENLPAADLRIRAWLPPGEKYLSLLLINPDAVWSRAGLHTGDRLRSINGAAVTEVDEFRNLLGRLAIGDTVRLELSRPSGAFATTITIRGYQRPVVSIDTLPAATEKQRMLREAWLAGRE